MSNTIEGLEAWMSDVSVQVDVSTDPAPAETISAPETPVTDTTPEPDAVTEKPEEGDAFEEGVSESEETETKLMLSEMSLHSKVYLMIADKMEEMNRMVNFLHEEGLNRSFVKLYTPELLNRDFGIVIPSLEAIDNTTTGTTSASQGAAGKVAGALSTAGNALKTLGGKIIALLQKFGKWVSDKLTAFKAAMTNLGNFIKGKVLRKDVNPNAETTNVSGKVKDLAAAAAKLQAHFNGETVDTGVTNSGEPETSTVGEQAKNMGQTVSLFQRVLGSLQGLPQACSKKIADIRAKLSGNAAADQSSQEEIKKTEATMKEATEKVNAFQKLGKTIRDFVDKYMGDGKETATV